MGRNIIAALLGISLLVNAVLVGVYFWTATQNTAEQATLEPTKELPPPRLGVAAATASAAVSAPTSLPPTTPPQPTEAPATEPTLVPTAAAPIVAAPTAAPVTAPPTPELTGPEWLQYLNLFRAEAGLPRVTENPQWSVDSGLHSRYMSLTGQLDHGEDPASPYYSNEGHAAGQNGNIAATVITMPPSKWAFNYWMLAVFHALPMIDPELQAAGFAEYRDSSAADPVTATLDIKRGLGAMPSSVRFPIMFPRDGGVTWVLRYSLPEFPFALTSCPNFQQPSGPPIILQIGKGDQTPNVTGTALTQGDKQLPHCEFDETNYFNPDGRFEKSGRRILGERDAVVIIPQSPLEPDKTYTVRIDVNGASYTWSFNTAKGPPGK